MTSKTFTDIKVGDRLKLTAATGSHEKYIGRSGTVQSANDVRPDVWAPLSRKITVLFDGDEQWNTVDCFVEYGDSLEHDHDT